MAESNDAASFEKLTELLNQANLKYSLKNYEEAVESYSQAAEMQTELRDELDPENAELLYLYGRCLYRVAITKSDVLGGQVASEKKPKKGEAVAPSPNQKLAEDVLEEVVEGKDGAVAGKKQVGKDGSKPYFQLVDAEWSDEEDEDEGEDGAEQALEDEDDFAIAYEILDTARVLLERKAKAEEEKSEHNGDSKGKAKAQETEMSEPLRQITERLADTHDLLAEISLENERFADAIEDSKAAAVLKDQLYPKSSSLVAEAHYKLSLAYEFESMAAIRAAEAKEGEAAVASALEKKEWDEELREKAAEEMAIAVDSCKLRLTSEEEKLTLIAKDDPIRKQQDESIAEVKEIIVDMEQRLKELRAAPVFATQQPMDMEGILGQLMGESKGEQQARIGEATKNANDLTGLVRKKKPTAEPAGSTAGAGASNGKRKLEAEDDSDSKRAKTEEP